MTLEALRQNTETLMELIGNYNNVFKQKSEIMGNLEDAKSRKDKTNIKVLTKDLGNVNYKLQILKQYVTNLMTGISKLVEEEKNAL